MTNLYSIFKSRNIILPTKVCKVKAMFFSRGHAQCTNVRAGPQTRLNLNYGAGDF